MPEIVKVRFLLLLFVLQFRMSALAKVYALGSGGNLRRMDKNKFLIELSESDRSMFLKAEFADQPRPQKVFSAIYHLEGQVNMSGFHAYFMHVEPEEIAFAAEALREIGAPNAAAIVQRAVDLVGPLPSDADEMEGLLDRLSAELDLLDQDFMAYPDDLTELLYAYVQAHPEEFA